MKEEDLGKEEERNLFYFGISLPHDLALGKSPRWGIRPSGSDSASTTKFLHPQNSLQGFSIHEVRTSQERLKNADSWDLVPIPTSLTSLPGDWDMVILRPLFDLPMTFKIPATSAYLCTASEWPTTMVTNDLCENTILINYSFNIYKTTPPH